jgi:hypothetical protein
MGSHLPQAFQFLGFGTFSAFLTLSRSSSAHHLPALFHAGPALGVTPFRADFLLRSCTFFRTPMPSCGWSENLRFRALVPARVLVPHGTATLLGFCLPRGVSLFRQGYRTRLSWASRARAKASTRYPSELYQRKGWLDSLEPAAPFEVHHLFDNPSLCESSGPWITPRRPWMLPSRGDSSTGLEPPLPELPGLPSR